jgi:hypothetical protein
VGTPLFNIVLTLFSRPFLTRNTRFTGPCACCRSRRQSHHQRVGSACCDIARFLIYSSMDGVLARFVRRRHNSYRSQDRVSWHSWHGPTTPGGALSHGVPSHSRPCGATLDGIFGTGPRRVTVTVPLKNGIICAMRSPRARCPSSISLAARVDITVLVPVPEYIILS